MKIKFLQLSLLGALTLICSAKVYSQLPDLFWNVSGNGGVTAANFIGTTNNIPLTFKVNNQLSGKIDHLNFNTLLGYQSGSGGTRNTFTGFRSGQISTGNENSFYGNESGNKNTSGAKNSFLGSQAGHENSTGNSNSFFGFQCGYSNITGEENSFFGSTVGFANTTGQYNSYFGSRAGTSNTSGSTNSGFGTSALHDNTTGASNVAIGNSTMYSNVSGNMNAATGLQALYSNKYGGENTAMGPLTLYHTNGAINSDFGSYNTALGSQAMYENQTGSYNVALGRNTLRGNITGFYNTAVGYAADVSAPDLTNATAIGNGAIVNASHKIRLGNSAVTVVEGPVIYTVSDGRFKSNIKESDTKALEFIKQLRPVEYSFDTKLHQEFLTKNIKGNDHLKNMSSDNFKSVQQTGFIAQEMETAIKKSGYAFSGLHTPENENDNYSIAYGMLTVPLVKGVQELSKQNEKLEQEVKELKELVNTLVKEKSGNQPKEEGSTTKIDVELNSSNSILLDQNIPNPFGDFLSIGYNLPADISNAQILFMDATGRVIKTVELTEKGLGVLRINTTNLSSGSYTYSIIANGKLVDTKHMVKAK